MQTFEAGATSSFVEFPLSSALRPLPSVLLTTAVQAPLLRPRDSARIINQQQPLCILPGLFHRPYGVASTIWTCRLGTSAASPDSCHKRVNRSRAPSPYLPTLPPTHATTGHPMSANLHLDPSPLGPFTITGTSGLGHANLAANEYSHALGSGTLLQT